WDFPPGRGAGIPMTSGDEHPWTLAQCRVPVLCGDSVETLKARVHPPGAISVRKAGIALNDLLAQPRPLARFPERRRVDDAVAKRTAIGTIAASNRAWNADELGPHFIAGEPHRRIAVTAHIHEFKVRGKFRIGNGVSALQVETLGVFQAR